MLSIGEGHGVLFADYRRAFSKAREEGLAVVSLGSKMINLPVVKRAQHTARLVVASVACSGLGEAGGVLISKLVEYAAGRLVFTGINGVSALPYQGVGKHRRTGRKSSPMISSSADYPSSSNKIAGTHRHFRNGDGVTYTVVGRTVWRRGVRFSRCQASVIAFLWFWIGS